MMTRLWVSRRGKRGLSSSYASFEEQGCESRQVQSLNPWNYGYSLPG